MELRFSSRDTLPLFLTPAELANVLGISRNTAYELVHRADFPVISVGKQYRISTEQFFKWLDNQAAA